MLPMTILAPRYQSLASWSNEQDTCKSLKTTGKQLRANLPAWTQALLRCSSQPSRPYSAQHTTCDWAKAGSACEPDLCACFCEYLPCNYPFSHDWALVQINTALWLGSCIVTTFNNMKTVNQVCCYPSSLSGSSTPRLPGASFPSADRVAALLLLASEAWVGVSRRLRTPPSTVLDGGLRATWPK